MRVLLMLSVAVVLGLGTSLRADDSDGKRPSREEMKKQFMAKYDKNKDGKISDEEKKAIKAEWAKRAEERKKEFMAKYDKNKDGKLCDEEKKAIKAEWAKHAHGHHHAHDGKAGEKKECPTKKAEDKKKECPAKKAEGAKKERPKKEKKARPKKEKKSKKEKKPKAEK